MGNNSIDNEDMWVSKSNTYESVEAFCIDPLMFDFYKKSGDKPLARDWDGLYRVYALIHPISDSPFYIGYTKNLKKRFMEHCRMSSNIGVRHVVFGLSSEGLTPYIVKLHETPDLDEAIREEERLIKKYSSRCLLMNIEHVYDSLVPDKDKSKSTWKLMNSG